MAWGDLADNFTPILYSAPGGGSANAWSQNLAAANAAAGTASLRYDTGSNDDGFLALVRKSGSFASARRNAAQAAWFKMNSGNVHYGGFLLRVQPANAAHGPADCDAADLRGGSGYVVLVDRFGGVFVQRGPLTAASLATLWAPNAAYFAPLLASYNGGWLYRVKHFDGPDGHPGFLIDQAADPTAAIGNDAHWTRVATFYDDSAGKIAAPGLFGAFLLTGSGNNIPLYLDAYQDLALAE